MTGVRSSLLFLLMALGSLALWIAIPVGWLWVGRDLDSAGARFLITLAGCVASMLGAAWFLFRVEASYLRSKGIEGDGPLDTLIAASAVIAIVALVVWWALLADSPSPSGPLQPV